MEASGLLLAYFKFFNISILIRNLRLKSLIKITRGKTDPKCHLLTRVSSLYVWQHKGPGYSERTRKVMKNLCGRGTSNELKSGPQSTCHRILMKIYVWRSHNISHLWLKIAIIWPIFSHFGLFVQVFCSTDYISVYFKLKMRL